MTMYQLLHDRTTVILRLFKTIDQEKEEFRQNHTTIVKDEYKIEDLRTKVQSIPMDVHKFSQDPVSRSSGSPRVTYILFLATLNWINP